MPEAAIILVVEAVLLAAVLVFREPKLLIPCAIVFLPFEYLQTEMLGTLGKGGAGGVIRTMLNPGKAAMAATVVVGAWRHRHQPARLFPDSTVVIPVVALAAIVILGVAWSHTQRPDNMAAILPLYVAFTLVAPSLIEDRKDLERIVVAFLVMGISLSLIAIAQRTLGVFEWRPYLIESQQYAYRSSATMADPNNLARVLNLVMALASGLVLVLGARRLTVYLAIPAIVLGLPALITTASRSGWLGFVLAISLMVLLAPVDRYARFRVLAVGAVVVTAAIAMILIEGGANADRIRTFSTGLKIAGQREHLIRAGWEMWKDSPYLGVGTGSWHNSLTWGYRGLLPWWTETTYSHTTAVTFLAEGGLLGISALAFAMVRVGLACWHAYRNAASQYNALIVAWCSVVLIQILLQSQAEGRLLEEPYLWLTFAVLAAIESGKVAFGRDAAGKVVRGSAHSDLAPSDARRVAPGTPAAASSASRR